MPLALPVKLLGEGLSMAGGLPSYGVTAVPLLF